MTAPPRRSGERADVAGIAQHQPGDQRAAGGRGADRRARVAALGQAQAAHHAGRQRRERRTSRAAPPAAQAGRRRARPGHSPPR